MTRRLLIVFAVLAVLVGGAVVADVVTRAHTESLLRDDLRTAGFGSPDVDIEGTPFLTQLLGGTLADVRLSADSYLADGLELTDVRARLTDVEAGSPSRAATFAATAALTPTAMTAALGAPLDITIVDGALVLTLRDAPLSASVVPHLRGDRIDLEVTELALAGLAVAPADIPLGLADAFEGLSLPIDGLPDGVVLEDLTVGETALQVSLSGTDVPLALLG